MKRKMVAFLAAGALMIASAGAVAAEGNSTPGLDRYHPQGSACGQYHGAFGYFGKDNNLAGGADGQATGAANSATGCQNNYPIAPAP